MASPDTSLSGRARLWLRDTIGFASARWTGLVRLTAAGDDINDLVAGEIARPGNAAPNRAELNAAFDALNRDHHNVFVIDIKARSVTVRPKTPTLATALAAEQMPNFFTRAERYAALIRFVVQAYRLDLDTSLALDVNDLPLENPGVPLFAFQNTASSHAILLPDIDFLGWNWYLGQNDRIPYDRKAVGAVFAGSSSGQMHDIADIARPTNPRLLAAAHFVGHPHIDFRISAAIQCNTPEAKALLESQPYFRPQMSWPQQWESRFLISIDGNGATCSRVALALKSNSALVKYASPFALFYFPKLQAGRDYLAVTAEREIEAIVERELTTPGFHRDIAEAGTRFYEQFLDRRRLFAYTALLLSAYAATLGPEGAGTPPPTTAPTA